MARSNTGSASNYFTATNPASASPTAHTIACWFRADSLTVDSGLVTLTDAAGNFYSSLTFDGTNSYGLGDNRVLLDGSFSIVAAAGTISATGTWNHCAGVVASSTSRTAYLNGVGGTTATGSRVITSFPDMSIGAFKGSTSGVFSPMNGAIAEVCVWDVALTASEIASLAKGASPLLIRPASLVSYIPLPGRGTDRDWLRSAAVTTVGTMAQTAHPPGLKGPQDAFIPEPPAAGGGTPATATGATVTEQGSLVTGSATGAASGAAATVTLASSLIAGAATGAASAAAVTLAQTRALVSGAATGVATGAAATVALSHTLLAGAATGASSAAAATVALNTSCLAGAATGAASAATTVVTEAASVVAGAATGAATGAAATVSLNASLLAGAGSGAASAVGATVSEVASIIAGSVSAGGTGAASGVTVSLAASLIAGTATGATASIAAGATVTETTALVAGAATGAALAPAATVSEATALIAGAAVSGSGGAQSAVAPPVRASFDGTGVFFDATSPTFDAESTRVLPAARVSLIPGAAEVNRTGQGATLTTTLSLIAGAAITDVAPVVAGATVTTVTTLLAGAASSTQPAMVSGATLGLASSLIAGSATGAVTTSTAITWDATSPTWDTTSVTFDATTGGGAGAGAGSFIGQPTYSFIAGTAIGASSAAGVTFEARASFMASPANVQTGPGTAQGATVTTVLSLVSGTARGHGWSKRPHGGPPWTNVDKPGGEWTVVPGPDGAWDKVA